MQYEDAKKDNWLSWARTIQYAI